MYSGFLNNADAVPKPRQISTNYWFFLCLLHNKHFGNRVMAFFCLCNLNQRRLQRTVSTCMWSSMEKQCFGHSDLRQVMLQCETRRTTWANQSQHLQWRHNTTINNSAAQSYTHTSMTDNEIESIQGTKHLKSISGSGYLNLGPEPMAQRCSFEWV